MDPFEEDRDTCKAATPGPWNCFENTRYFQHYCQIQTEAGENVTPVVRVDKAFSEPSYSRDDFVFFAKARTRWPAALDEIDFLKRIIADLQQDSTAWQMGCAAGVQEGWNACVKELVEKLQGIPATEENQEPVWSFIVKAITAKAKQADAAHARQSIQQQMEIERLTKENEELRKQLDIVKK